MCYGTRIEVLSQFNLCYFTGHKTSVNFHWCVSVIMLMKDRDEITKIVAVHAKYEEEKALKTQWDLVKECDHERVKKIHELPEFSMSLEKAKEWNMFVMIH